MTSDEKTDFDFLAGGGEVGEIMRGRDWSSTRLGPPEDWPATLKTMLRLILASPQPMWILWGSELIQFYNDPCREIFGPERHPSILGVRAIDSRYDTWHLFAPQVDQVMSGRGAIQSERYALTVNRGGRHEQTWWTYSFNPIEDEFGICGMLSIFNEVTQDVVNEEALRTFNALLERSAIETAAERNRIWRISKDILAVASFDGYLRNVNPAFTEILGWNEQEAVGIPIMELIHPEQQRETSDALGRLQEGIPVRNFEVRTRCKNEHYRWLSWTVVSEERKLYCVCRDIDSEKKSTQQRLQTSETRLQLALEAGGMGAWEWNIKTGETVWSPGMAALHGVPFGATAQSMREYEAYVHPDDRAHLVAEVERNLTERSEHRIEYRIVHPDRSEHWVETRSKLVLDDIGTPAYMAGVCMDITRRKRTEESLRFIAKASNELAKLTDYQTALNRIATLAVPSFADWCAVDMLNENGDLERLAVAHVDPAKTQHAHELHRRYPPDPDEPGGTWGVIRTGKAQLVPEITDDMLEARIKDAKFLEAIRNLGLKSYIGAPLSSLGKTIGVVTFITAESRRNYDSEDLALAEDLARRASTAIENHGLLRELKDVDHRKDVFLATLAHELRNPLAPIMNALNVTKAAHGEWHVTEQMNSVIERQTGYLTRLVDDLLDVSRINTGKIELRKRKADLASIIHAAVETSRPHIESAHHRLSVTLPDEPAEMLADPVRLAQVFANLLNNAAKYTNQGGRIELNVEAFPEEYAVRIKDNGIGITPAMLKKIFSMFAQVTHPLNRNQGGLGIGLSLVEGLVKLHGGNVEAHSEGLGRGSEFIVRLPRSTETNRLAAASDEDATSRSSGSAPRRVLVVDDNVDAADATAELLRMLGNEVSVAHDGLTGIELVSRMKPDAVLLDIGLPDMDGYEVARRIRSLSPDRRLRLIALTGWSADDDKRRSAEAGFDEYWIKPIDFERLKQV